MDAENFFKIFLVYIELEDVSVSKNVVLNTKIYEVVYCRRFQRVLFLHL